MTPFFRNAAFALTVWLLMGSAPAMAGIEARIGIAEQRMRVFVDGAEAYVWSVSTGRRGYDTPRGRFRPERMHRRYFSKKYDGAPMPYAIFFNGGIAVHGTTELRRLGRPASHGCVRLHPDHAKALFTLVGQHGMANARVLVTE